MWGVLPISGGDMRILILASAAVAAGLAAGFTLGVGGAQAGTVTWNLSSPAGDVGSNSHTYTSITGGFQLTASGFTSLNNTMGGSFGSPVDLWGKTGGGDETGLGLANDASGDHEIQGTNVIEINFTNARLAGVTNFGFQMGSSTADTTGGETWKVLGSVSGTPGTFNLVLSLLDDENPHTLSGVNDTYNFYVFEVVPHAGFPNDNVLIQNVTGVSAVPEPATWAMMLLGFAGLGFAFRQSRRKVSFA
jgi:hypothetical protein